MSKRRGKRKYVPGEVPKGTGATIFGCRKCVVEKQQLFMYDIGSKNLDWWCKNMYTLTCIGCGSKLPQYNDFSDSLWFPLYGDSGLLENILENAELMKSPFPSDTQYLERN